MSICAKWQSRFSLGLATGLALGLVAALGTPQKSPAKKNNRVHVVQWAKDAKLSRKLTKAEADKIAKSGKKSDKKAISAYKEVPGVKANTHLQVLDVLETQKQGVVLAGGTLFNQKYGPNTKVTFLRINPTEFDFTKPIDFQLLIEKGKGQFRAGTLAQPSKVRTMGHTLATAPKGTAYSLNIQGQQTTLVVAEGKVDIYPVSAPSKLVTVNPREKFIYTTGQPFPTQATPISMSDEREIRELLSLPTQNLVGYVGGRELRRPDAESIVTLNVRPAFRILAGNDVSQWPKRPNSVYPSASRFRYVNETGGEKILDGEFLGASKDGKVWGVYRSGQGTLAISPTGKVLSTLSQGKLRSVQVAPNGSRIIAFGEELGQRGMILSYRPTGGPPTRVEGPMGSSPDFEVIWRRGGARCFIVQKIQGKNVVYNPEASGNAIQPYFDADPFEISPGGDWLMSIAGPNRYYFTPLNTGQAAPPALAVSSETKPLFLGAGTGPNDTESIAYTPLGTGKLFKKNPAEAGQGTPFESPRGVTPETYHDSALSPNGELVTFLNGTTKTAYVADSADLSRDSDTYVGIIPPSAWEWVSGCEVWYEDMLEGVKDSIIITLGVKRRGGTGPQPRPPSGKYAGINVSVGAKAKGNPGPDGGDLSTGYVEISPGLYQPKLVLAQGKVGRTESFERLIGRIPGAVAAINGSFFDAYGKGPIWHPDQTLITNGQFIHRSDTGSVAGFDVDGNFKIVRLGHRIWGKRVDGQGREHSWYATWLNRLPTASPQPIIYTPHWGDRTGVNRGRQIVVSNGRVVSVSTGSQTIPNDGFVLMVEDYSHPNFGRIQVGDRLSYEVGPRDGEWNSPLFKFVEGVGAGPTLVQNGTISLDPVGEKFTENHIVRDIPAVRSCIGVKKDGTILLVATYGTIRQVAQKMKALGCVDAMNLDGGESSTVYGAGKYVRPPGRPLSNALVFVRKGG